MNHRGRNLSPESRVQSPKSRPAGCRRSQGSPNFGSGPNTFLRVWCKSIPVMSRYGKKTVQSKLGSVPDTFDERCDLMACMNVAMEFNRRWTQMNADQAGLALRCELVESSHGGALGVSHPARQGLRKAAVERGGKGRNADPKRVERGGTDSTFFHLFPRVSTCFHLGNFFGRNFTLTTVPGLHTQIATINHQPPPSSVFQGIWLPKPATIWMP